MNDNMTQSIRESYDRLADEYAHRIFNELQHKPLDRELLDRFADSAFLSRTPWRSARADTDRIHGIGSRWRNWREFRRMLDRPDHPPAIYCQDISKNLVSPSALLK
jgi:hypothetical protein